MWDGIRTLLGLTVMSPCVHGWPRTKTREVLAVTSENVARRGVTGIVRLWLRGSRAWRVGGEDRGA